jgi:hypothetical protein
MNRAIRTRLDIFNKGEEPLTPPQPDVIDLTKKEEQEDYKQRLIEEDRLLMQIVPPPDNDIHHD